MMKNPVFLRDGILWIATAVLLLAAASPPLLAQDYTPLEGLRVSDGRVQFLFASAGQCIVLSNSSINGVVYTTHESIWQRRTGSTWVDIPGTEREGLCSYSPTSPGEYRLVAEISIDGERGHYSSENTLTVEGAPAGTGTESFSFPDLGGWSATSSGTEETVRVGYGRISTGAGSTTPSGIAIFQYRDSQGVLIAEASVPATELIEEGRIFVEVEGPVNTGLAIANPNDVPATIRFYFTDTTGANLGSGNFELGEHEQTAKFLNQEPFNEALPDGSPVLGTFTFESSVPIAVIALRGFTNEADEFLMTTLPVAPLSPDSEETVYIPHFAAGGGWVTQVILVNPTDSTITGTVGFLGPGSGPTEASPVILTLDDGSTGSDFDYSIPPRSSQRFTTANPFGELNSGSVRAVPDSGNAAPSGLVVFSYAPAGKTLSEAGVPALPKGSAFRVYAEASGMPGQMGSINTGLAITNVADTSNTVTLEVTHLDGSLAAAPEPLTLPPSGQVARFLNEIFSLPDNFSGVLRVTSTADIAIVALRLRVNENDEIKVTTLSPSNEMDPPTSENRFFAHLADSEGWSTQFILFSGTAGQAASGTLSFIDTAGQPWDLTTDSGVVTVPEPTPLAPADDRGALEALYDATNGANWSSNDNWKTDEPLGQWFGVSTNSDGRVTLLNLHSNQLSGTIPVEIGNLTRLQDLDLGFNQLSGTIPVEIGNLTRLQDLVLDANQLSGTIPAEIGNLTRLTSLWLSVNQLSGTIPVEIGNLTSLEHLLLPNNQLSGTIPAEIGNLTRLISLNLLNNQLSGTIPAEIGNLTRLFGLRVDTDTGLCLAPDFDLTSPFATQSGLPVCSGTPTPLAPADEAAFNELVVGKRVLSPNPAYYTDFVSPGRFRETEGSDIWTGSYTYRNTGSDTGTVTFNYDDGDRCTASFTFVSTTAGTATYTCNDGSSGSSNWRLAEIP